jgi:hypothetical protein
MAATGAQPKHETTSRGRLSIARVMTIVALLAANLALLREVPWEARSVPTIWVFLGIADFVVVWKLICRFPLRAGHYTFLVVCLGAYLVLVTQAAMERIHPMAPFIRSYQQISGDQNTSVMLREVSRLGDIWMSGVLALLIAWTLALGAGWLERRRGWDLAAWYRGGLVGFGVVSLLTVLTEPFLRSTPRRLAVVNLVLLAICVLVGGKVGLARLRSVGLERGGADAKSAAPSPRS